jgi:urea transport system substrate-binding protein
VALWETSLKDVALMAIAELNEAGGLLGRPLEAVVVDPASSWPSFADKARALVRDAKVAVTFGCWTSASRKAALPAFEEHGGLLFYPAAYEGQESSFNAFYTGATPNQQATPVVNWLLGARGGLTKRFVLLGTDDAHPRTVNKILRSFLRGKGLGDQDILETYVPSGHVSFETVVASIKKHAAGARTAVVSTVFGDSNAPFYKELGRQGVSPQELPVVALSLDEEDLRGMDRKPLVGHLAVGSYLMTVDKPTNAELRARWQAWVRKNNLPGGDKRVITDAMEATYLGVKLWAQAVRQAKTTAVGAVRQALGNQTILAPSGYVVTMDGRTHHLDKPVFLGRIRPDGLLDVVWKSAGPIRAEVWSQHLPETAKRVANWTYPWVCGGCEKPTFP